LEYFNTLEKACVERDFSDFTRMVAYLVAQSLDLYIEAITGKKPQPLKPGSSAQS
jgi:hypothetical protein